MPPVIMPSPLHAPFDYVMFPSPLHAPCDYVMFPSPLHAPCDYVIFCAGCVVQEDSCTQWTGVRWQGRHVADISALSEANKGSAVVVAIWLKHVVFGRTKMLQQILCWTPATLPWPSPTLSSQPSVQRYIHTSAAVQFQNSCLVAHS